MAAGWLAGVTEFYRVGGAQAVAAMAYGTETIGRVEKIVGPGNIYVTAAKASVLHECGIDMQAGPTEIGIMSETGDAAGIAADLVAQAEHDPDALAVLVTPNEELAKAVLAQVKVQSKQMLRRVNRWPHRVQYLLPRRLQKRGILRIGWLLSI